MSQIEHKHTVLVVFLCTALVLALLIMIFGYFATHLNAAKRQRAAIETLRERQSQLTYRQDIELARQRQKNPSAEHSLLFRLGTGMLGRDFFDDVEIVMLRGRDVGDQDMRLLTQLKGVRRVILTGVNVTDAGLDELATISTLETVHLNFVRTVTESGISRLRATSADVKIDALLNY